MSMWNYFFYGTLMDPEVVREVLGRPLSGCSPQSAMLAGFKRVSVADVTYPALTPDPDSHVDGLMVSKISELEASRISRYEGNDYTVQVFDVMLGDGAVEKARVFLPKKSLNLTDIPWDFERWQKQDKKRFLKNIHRNVLI
ncbi:MAG: gamma-glutamylcyclotransferase family protein [Rhodospirillales bacterium]